MGNQGQGIGNNNMMGGQMGNNMGMVHNMGMGMPNNDMGMGNMTGGGGGSGNNNANPGNSNDHRPLVGGGSAAAYEAARADHYRKLEEKQTGKIKGEGNNMGMNGMASNGGMNMNNSMPSGGNVMPVSGLSVNPNQHYEMLKLHHMNLLNEIQETTLMMNLYQQQQLQQQGGGDEGGNNSMANGGGGDSMPNGGNNMGGGGNPAGGGNQMGRNTGNLMMGGRGNGNQMGGNGNQMGGGGNGNQMGGGRNLIGMMNQSQGMGGGSTHSDASQAQVPNQERPNSRSSGSAASGNGPTSSNSHDDKSTGERAAWLRKLKEDIAQRESEAAELEASLGADKRRNEGDGGDSSNKRHRKDQDQNVSTAV